MVLAARGGSGTAVVTPLVLASAAVAATYVGAPSDGVPDILEAAAATALGVADCGTVGGKALNSFDQSDADRELSAVTIRWLTEAKLAHGPLKDHEAERRMLWRWLAERMKEADMRNKDAVALIPIIIGLYWSPTIDDVVGHWVSKTRVAKLMRAIGPTPPA